MRILRDHILVVDDEDHIRFGLSLTLRKAGFQVVVAVNGIEALNCLRARHGRGDDFALMILDLRMPLMGGVRLLSELAVYSIHLPVIGITGCAEADAMEKLQRAGCVATLGKPFTSEDFLAQVESVLAQRQVHLVRGDTAGEAS